MNNNQSEQQDEAEIYEIRLRGQLDVRWARWFDGFTVTSAPNGDTVLSGAVVDQAALHGLLKKVRDVGLPLRSIQVLPKENIEP